MGPQTGLHQGVAMTTSTNPARESLRQEQQEQREAAQKGPDAELDTALKATFPASDPIAAQAPTKSGAADGKAS